MMMTGNRKEEERVFNVLLHFIQKKPDAQQEQMDNNSELKKDGI